MDYDNLENQVRERVKKVLDDAQLSENALSGGKSAVQSQLNRQLSHNATVSVKTLLRILDACPDVSADWLLRGSGDMYVTAGTSVTGANNVTGHSATVIGQQVGTLTEDFVRELIAEKDRQIRMLIEKLGK